jgi:hypothetical protein
LVALKNTLEGRVYRFRTSSGGTLANALPTLEPKSFEDHRPDPQNSPEKYAITCVFTNTARVVKLVVSGNSKK